MNVVQNAFFLPARGGHCFCVYRRPSRGVSRGVVLHLPAFGDEMNKSRVMTARGARAFAAQGFGVLQVDLLGCGDSDGVLADATLAGCVAPPRARVCCCSQECRSVSPSRVMVLS